MSMAPRFRRALRLFFTWDALTSSFEAPSLFAQHPILYLSHLPVVRSVNVLNHPQDCLRSKSKVATPDDKDCRTLARRLLGLSA